MTVRDILFCSQGKIPYWYSKVNGKAAGSMVMDSYGNIIVAGAINNSSGGLYKISPYGIVIWQKIISVSGITVQDMCIDSSDNVYFTGYKNNVLASGGTGTDMYVSSFDTNGNHRWTSIKETTTLDVYMAGYTVCLDATGSNVYVGYYGGTSGVQDTFVATYSRASGSYVTQFGFGVSGTSDLLKKLIVYGGFIYAIGYSNVSGYGDATVVKFNTSGTIQWQKALVKASVADEFESGAFDSSGNLYVLGGTGSTSLGLYAVHICKFDTAGNLLFQKAYGLSGGAMFTLDLVINSLDEIFVTCYCSSPQNGYIIKLDTSGNIVWQRLLKNGTTYLIPGGLVVKSNDMYFCSNDGSTNSVIFRLPTDGSLSGTYSTFTISTGDLVSTTPTTTVGSVGYTSKTNAYTNSTLTPTVTNNTLTFTTTNIG